ncbi:unnamed protein product [Cylicocyclus nassatus]|uniref:Uncharacterized protein n=1 Tax=Cylicocyclus nassatus TaxID=53992 RepID=A0AA36GJ16_CYLNA|nr:unnamed protein product [Cylicocyclus nassatus]
MSQVHITSHSAKLFVPQIAPAALTHFDGMMAAPLLLFLIIFVNSNGIRHEMRAVGNRMSHQIDDEKRTELREKMRPVHYDYNLEASSEMCYHHRKHYYTTIGSFQPLWVEKEELFEHFPNPSEIADRMRVVVPDWRDAHEFGCYYELEEYADRQKVVCIFAFLERDE